MRWVTAAVLDLCCVIVFVAIGRRNHGEAGAVAGLLRTAWPFCAGLALGWLLARAWRRPAALAPAGVTIWLTTVAAGMTLRVISGQGTAITFIIVALAFLGLVLLGWRLSARRLSVHALKRI
jgi:hypothetical protein